MEREFKYDILHLIKNRWSPRAFSSEKIEKESIMKVLEAASYAPSCFNEQPWRFLIAKEGEKYRKVFDSLAEPNKLWAKRVPVFIVLIAKKTFTFNGKDNFWHSFDLGTAWGYMSLEAERNGLITHAMGGFDRKGLKESLTLPDDYEVIVVIALGKLGNKEELPEELVSREEAGTRKKLEELIIE